MRQRARSDQDADTDRIIRRRATQFAVWAAGFLVVIKAMAYLASGSVAMLGSLSDSVLDLLASVINFLAVRHAMTPADHDHRFGHGKAEALAGMGRGLLILVTAGFVLMEAVRRLIEPEALRNEGLVVSVLSVSALVSLVLAFYQYWAYRQTRSVAIGADAANYSADVLVSFGAIGAVWLTGLPGLSIADPLFGFAIAIVIATAAVSIILKSYDELMDREMDDEERERIKAIVLSHREVKGVHDLRTRRSGMDLFIQFHLELDPNLSLREAHRIADEVEALVAKDFPGADVLAHQEPVGEFIENDLVKT